MNTARVALLASALLGTLALAAAAFAAPSGDGAAESGGAQALPVVPSEGGGSEPLDLLAPEIAVPPPVAMPPVQEVPEAPETAPGEVVVPLEGPGASPEPAPVVPPEEGASSGGGFSFLALSGSGIAAGIAKLAASLLRGVGG